MRQSAACHVLAAFDHAVDFRCLDVPEVQLTIHRGTAQLLSCQVVTKRLVSLTLNLSHSLSLKQLQTIRTERYSQDLSLMLEHLTRILGGIQLPQSHRSIP